jgi:uncharacterized protein (DUF2062 family)
MVPVIQGATVPIVVRGASEERVSKSTRKQESLTRKENTMLRKTRSSYYRTNCSGYSYSINCRTSNGPGSAAEGFAIGLANGISKRKARKAAMASCLLSMAGRSS